MKIPFTIEQFFNVFEKYNLSVFPAQVIILLLALAGIFLLHSEKPLRNKVIGAFLGLLWIWTGLVYHILFFTGINKAASVFGGLFILQGVLILIISFLRQRLVFTFRPDSKDYIGYFFILFGLMIYPFIGYLTGGSMVKTISLGLPCPSTIFTFGFLMLTTREFPKYLLIIPSLWAIVGLSAAINFGVYQDYMMIIAAIVADIYLLRKYDRHKNQSRTF